MKKIPVWKNVLLIFSLIVAIIIATFAWFYTNPGGVFGPLDVNVGEASFIQVSDDDGDHWSESLELEFGINKIFKEISGNGITFFAPNYEVVETPEAMVSTIQSFAKVNVLDYCYEQTFSFRSDGNQDLYLAPESFVKALDDRAGCIDGAIRVAFFEVNEQNQETLKCIWAPNSATEFSKDTNSFTRAGKVESYYYYQKTTTPVDEATLAGGASNPNVEIIRTTGSGKCGKCGYHAGSKLMWSCGEHMPANAPSLLSIRVDEGEDFGYSRLKIRVWLEGSDRECVSLASGQKFTMNFQFSTERGE